MSDINCIPFFFLQIVHMLINVVYHTLHGRCEKLTAVLGHVVLVLVIQNIKIQKEKCITRETYICQNTIHALIFRFSCPYFICYTYTMVM